MDAQVFLTSLAATTVLAHDYGPTELGTVDYVGAVGWFVGMLFEVVADHQKETWRARPENKDKQTWITEGLWSTCRHPNYFGEILLWSSVLLVATQSLAAPTAPKLSWVAYVAPFLPTYLLIHVSGIPAMVSKPSRLAFTC